jgi:CRISPR system Cascade subunit CasD
MSVPAVALRLHGPLQSWGGPTIGDNRPTLPFPTRSGVIGLLAACLGIRRSDLGRMSALACGARVHVRVDAPGTPLVDDQTIQNHPEASPTRQTIQSKRTYLCDASFTAVVAPGAGVPVAELEEAVRKPVFAPFLGRRSCVISTPLFLRQVLLTVDPIEAFSDLEPGPIELLTQLHTRHRDEGGTDFYLDLADYPGALRKIPIRDEWRGPLQRQWSERFAVHVRLPPATTTLTAESH